MGRKRKRKLPKLQLKTATVHSVIAVILIALGLLIVVSFSGQGSVLAWINAALAENLGFTALLLPFFFIASGMVLLQTKWAWSKPNVLLGVAFIIFGLLGLFKTGTVGAAVFANMSQFIAPSGSYILFASSLVIGCIVMLQLSVPEMIEALHVLAPQRKKKVAEEDKLQSSKEKQPTRFSLPQVSLPFGKKKSFSINDGQKEVDTAAQSDEGAIVATPQTPPKPAKEEDILPKLSVKPEDMAKKRSLVPNASKMVWEYPPLSLLSDSEGGKANRGDVKQNASVIESTLESFGIKANVEEVNYGPSVTQYALRISRGTKLSKITSLSTDLALALAAPTGQIRIEAPIAGRSLVGVEVPNYTSQFVTLRKLLSNKKLKKNDSKLNVALGINVAGEPLYADIAKMPHVLIAGSTGSGKSVCINTIMCSILFRASPAEVKFILVDPKRVELTGYNNIPHLLVPVIVDPKKVVSALKWATVEMDNRYKKLAEVGVKNIDGYNELAGHAAMSKIVIVIDELADVMLFAPGEVEESITRIAQMARAVGIHLVLATQRPSVDVITGLIKANIPARMAFNVSSMTDSRVILDGPGAEKLLGKGDMLFIPPDKPKPVRVQGTFVSDKEIKSLIDFVKNQGHAPEYQEDITTKYKGSGGKGMVMSADGEERDELFEEIAQFVMQSGKASSSSIQRRFSVGYNRAARVVDQMHAAGMVGPAQGSKPRDVHMQVIMEFLRSRQES